MGKRRLRNSLFLFCFVLLNFVGRTVPVSRQKESPKWEESEASEDSEIRCGARALGGDRGRVQA